MNYSLPASPTIADTDNDGFIDTAYIGDLGDSMWRFKFCTASDGSTCSTSNWSGGRLFESSTGNIRPIFTMPTVFKDDKGNLWVAWGTGDKTDPTAASANEKFFAVKDNARSSTFNINDLENITGGTFADAPSKPGWYMNLSGHGEKMLGDPVAFGGVIYFTTYTPPAGNDPCSQAGTGSLYGVNYTTGAGALVPLDASGHPVGSPSRTMTVGAGIPSAPILSMKPIGGSYGSGSSAADVYLTVSGGGAGSESTMRVNLNPPTLANRTNLLYWKDRRLE
jgi:Tfp pilus tip-associated adhesin PilY1